jgi:hypothetical protein
MAELIAPTTRVHASFLAVMTEFQAEGRGGSGDGARRRRSPALSLARQIMTRYISYRELGRGWAEAARKLRKSDDLRRRDASYESEDGTGGISYVGVARDHAGAVGAPH